MYFTHLAQASLAFFLVMQPIDGLACDTAIKSDFAGTTFVDARFRTSRSRTGCIGHVGRLAVFIGKVCGQMTFFSLFHLFFFPGEGRNVINGGTR